LVTTGKYRLSIDFRKSIDVNRDMRATERVDFSSILSSFFNTYYLFGLYLVAF